MLSKSYSYNLITACTNRKRLPAHPRLQLGDLPSGKQPAVLEQWLGRLRGVKSEIPVASTPARQTYCGRGFAEAVVAAGDQPLYVVSAGLGLVQSTDLIPSYSATTARGRKDSVATKCSAFDLALWWKGLRDSPYSRRSIQSALGSEDSKSLTIVALPRTYFAMVEDELASLDANFKDRLRIVGLAATYVSKSLREYVMPIDERLDGPDSPLRGTKADFSQRTGRFLIEQVISKRPRALVHEHRKLVLALINDWRTPERLIRQKLSDDEVKSQIRDSWNAVGGRSTAMLRFLRDNLGFACEQSRFKFLFREVASEREALE